MSLWCFGVEQLCVWRQATGANLQIFEKCSASLISFIRHIATKKKQTLAKFLGRQPLLGSLAASLSLAIATNKNAAVPMT